MAKNDKGWKPTMRLRIRKYPYRGSAETLQQRFRRALYGEENLFGGYEYRWQDVRLVIRDEGEEFK